MSLLREYIRLLLKEDPMGFVHDLAAASEEHGEWSWGEISKGAGRDIKRAFNKHADHQWLSTLDTVHWTDAYGLKGLTSGKDELSATMSLPGGKLDPATFIMEVGLWIKGRITLAANDQDALYTGKWDSYMHFADNSPRTKIGKAQRHRQKSSGVNKLPTMSKDYSRYGQLKPGVEFMEKMARNIPYVLDQSTWDPSASGPNEALVDNWKPIGIIVVDDRDGSRIKAVKYHAQNPSKAVGMIKQIFQAAEMFGIPLYDVNRNELWNPGKTASDSTSEKQQVNEGVWDALKQIFAGLKGMFTAAVDNVDTGKVETKSVSPGALDAKDNSADQIAAVAIVAQLAGYGIEDASIRLRDAQQYLASETLQNLPQTESERAAFNEAIAQLNNSIASAYGSLVGWLQSENAEFANSLREIASAADDAENASEMLQGITGIVGDIMSLDIPGEFEKIAKSDGVMAAIEAGNNDAQQWVGEGPGYISRIGKGRELQAMAGAMYDPVKEVEGVVLELSGEGEAPGTEPVDSDLLSHYIRGALLEGSLENIAIDKNEILSRGLEIQKSPIQGVGVFATKAIPADTDLGPAQILKKSGRYDVTKLGRRHNHSYEPSCYSDWIGDARHLFSGCDLVPGDEITIDYTRQPDLEQPKQGWE